MGDDMLKTVGIVAAAAGVGFFLGQKMAKGPAGFGERTAQASKKVKVLSPAAAKQLIAACSPLIIDVRDSGDVDNGIKGAINIPLSNLVFMADQDFALPGDVKVKGEVKVPAGTKFVHDKLKGDKGKPILISCGLGGQAVIGGGILADYGFTNVHVVDGGNMGWMDNDGAVCPCANKTVAKKEGVMKEIHAIAKASISGTGYSNEVVENLFDGGSETQANTGEGPPGWIKLAWPHEMYVSKVRVQISQSPDCETTHILFADDLEIHRWDGHTKNMQWLEHDVDNTVKELKIATSKSKSWVCWKQLNVTGCEA